MGLTETFYSIARILVKGILYQKDSTSILAYFNGTFQNWKASWILINIPKYSVPKRIDLRPDIVEYDPDEYQPKFDLIIGTASMKELGIILDFKEQ